MTTLLHPPWLRLKLTGLIGLCCMLPFDSSAAESTPKDDFTEQRLAMVESQIASRGISNPATLAAMRAIPRHEFIPPLLRHGAYEDHPLPIGHGQTISQPYIVAFMTEAIAPKRDEKILEIGSGCGYQAAILAHSGAEIFTMEIVEPLAAMARENLKRLGLSNVQVRHGDGYRGWPEQAPFDAIIVTCAPDNIPPDLIAQLREGGRMIIPVGNTTHQDLILLRKYGDRLEKQTVLPVRFVPMTGEAERAH